MYIEMLKLIFPEILLSTSACIILLFDVFMRSKLKTTCYYFALISLTVIAVVTYKFMPATPQTLFSNAFVVDNFSGVLKIVLCVLLATIFLYSKTYMQERKFLVGEFFVLCMFSLLGMMILCSSGNFLTLYLAIELTILPLYALIVMVKHKSEYPEAAMKYFIIGSLGSGLMLYGISLIYGASGSVDFSAIAATSVSPTLILGMVLVLVAVAIEFGAVPFHMWLPDVYEGSPSPVTMFISSLAKVAVFAMGYRLLSLGFINLSVNWQQVMLPLAIASIAFGNIVAIAQVNIKRMLAYSTIAHIGFILLGLASATTQGFANVLFYVVTYALMALAAFAVIIYLARAGFEADRLENFRGLAKTNPIIAFCMLLVMLSLAGVPPLVGFYAKYLILQNVVNAGLIWYAFIALVFTVIGSYYYLRIIVLMYFQDPIAPQNSRLAHGMTFVATAVLTVNALLLLATGIVPVYLLTIVLHAFT